MTHIYECQDCHWVSESPEASCPICGMPIEQPNTSDQGTLDDFDRRVDDFYSEQQGDIGDQMMDFYDYEPSVYDGTYSEE